MNEIELGGDRGSRAHEMTQAIGATVVSLILATGLGGWLLFGQGDAVRTGNPPHSSGGDATTMSPVADSRRASQEVPWPEQVFRQAPAVPTYYLVATQEHADAVLVGIHEAAAIRGNFGKPYPDEQVIVLDSQETEERFFLDLHEQDAVRGDMGMPPRRIVDLRARRTRQARYHRPAQR